MSDWQKGDLALCVAEETAFVTWAPKLGRVYTVIEVGMVEGALGLTLKEDPTAALSAWRATGFRKVTPPKDMQIDSEEVSRPERLREPASDLMMRVAREG